MKDSNIGEIIKFVIENKLLKKSEDMDNFDYEDSNNQSFYNELVSLKYEQFAKLYQLQQDSMPFSTKHGTKGDEFENVLVVIDDKAWEQNYNFNNYFEGIDKKSIDRFNRTKNLFYVVCSRAINSLYIVNLTELSPEAKNTINEWFGRDNVCEI